MCCVEKPNRRLELINWVLWGGGGGANKKISAEKNHYCKLNWRYCQKRAEIQFVVSQGCLNHKTWLHLQISFRWLFWGETNKWNFYSAWSDFKRKKLIYLIIRATLLHEQMINRWLDSHPQSLFIHLLYLTNNLQHFRLPKYEVLPKSLVIRH